MRIQCALALKGAYYAYATQQQKTGQSSESQQQQQQQSFSSSSSWAAFTDTVFDVVFQQRSTANYMTCSMAQISVQSVRWPATRFTGR